MPSSAIPRPGPSEYAPYYARYVDLVPEGDILEVLERQAHETVALLGTFGEARGDSRYAPSKWSVKEVTGHLMDVERVLSYRALRFSRNDPTPLPGFDENAFVANSSFGARALQDLADELQILRRCTLAFFRGLSADELARRGTANNVEFSVRAIPYIIAGHERHHQNILRERYV
jgi:hypothetical protein